MSGERVLIAEDDAAMRAFLADVLRDDGYEVLEAVDGRELFWFVEFSERLLPVDLIISDLRMPAYSGLEVIEAWAHAQVAHRVVLMSAFPDPDVRRRAQELGAVLLAKPFDVRLLQSLVREKLAEGSTR